MCISTQSNNFQVIYGGRSSNRTIDRIIKESPLIQVYRDMLNTVESVFILGPQTVRHGEPDMSKTYKQMVRDLYANGLFQERPGRSTVREIMNAFAVGHEIFDEKGFKWDFDEDDDDGQTGAHYDEDDQRNGIDMD